jgi:hypothetical protein
VDARFVCRTPGGGLLDPFDHCCAEFSIAGYWPKADMGSWTAHVRFRGYSGHSKGRPKGSRNKLSEDFFRDLCEAWQAFGKPALETMAMLYPVEFVRLAASLMPKEPEATITPVVMERMSDAQLDAMIARCIEDGLDPAATD